MPALALSSPATPSARIRRLSPSRCGAKTGCLANTLPTCSRTAERRSRLSRSSLATWSSGRRRLPGDLVMDVQSVTPCRIGDRDVIVYRGMTHALSGSGFLDSTSGDPLGDDSWSIPVSGRVYNRFPIDEADFVY